MGIVRLPGESSLFEFNVESAHPHRIVAWRGPDGGVGKLTGSARIKYWQTAREGDEALRKQLGLPVHGAHQNTTGQDTSIGTP